MTSSDSLYASDLSTALVEQAADDGWKLVHERSISISCAEHADGRIRAVGVLLDEKGVPVVTYSGKVIGSGEAMHRMRVDLVVSIDLIIDSVEVEMLDVPGESCLHVRSVYQSLCGVAISKGFSGIVRERLGGISGCAHLTNLILQMGPAIMQTHYARSLGLQQRPNKRDALMANLVGTCHVFSPLGPGLRGGAATIVAVAESESIESPGAAPPTR